MKTKAILILTFLSTALFTVMGFITDEEDNHLIKKYNYLEERLKNTKIYTIQVIEAMPESEYGYKPNKDVRSYTALASHIIYSIEWNLEVMKGTPIKWNPGDEDGLSKKELITYANEQFNAFIDFVLKAEETSKLTDKIIDVLNHNAHHRGQMVTYLRMKGIEPPKYR
ncbi:MULTISPECIES: DinB family protein [Aquimarina]|uniref:DinB family protein n=1 Tax=Aquimarina algiphila TaxID=2047982 RepID=A0A554VM95_9FLAO|nr:MULTISPECIES: DinB family protein [Aquimarina]TSE09351.1 hypothetical protein FOF46_08845 [Aquimarina algiphila]